MEKQKYTLEEIRKKLGLSRSKFAEQLGVSFHTIVVIERKPTKEIYDNALKLLEKFEKPTNKRSK